MTKNLFLIILGYILFTANIFAQINSQLTYSQVSDIEGNIYQTINIGPHMWMAENLRTTKYNDGSNIPLITDSVQWWNNTKKNTSFPMMSWYDNDLSNHQTKIYGGLYNWFAINPLTNGNKNICPKGWHVPTDAEWSLLISSLGGKSVSGGKLKSTGMEYWMSPNKGATNSSGFSGLPGGGRNSDGAFFSKGDIGYWWSSTELDASLAWNRYLGHNYSTSGKNYYSKSLGFSVRCVKD